MENWEKQLSCAQECSRCNKSLTNKERRILSIVDHQPICIDCKKEEEKEQIKESELTAKDLFKKHRLKRETTETGVHIEPETWKKLFWFSSLGAPILFKGDRGIETVCTEPTH